MEKIYDESQQQQRQQQQQKKVKIDGVSLLSFAVAIFAVVSLVAAGVSGFRYALPETVVTLPSTFNGAEESDIFMKDRIVKQEFDYHYYASSEGEVPLLCLQRDVDFNAGTFNSTGSGYVSSDIGLLYLLANLAPNGQYTYPSEFNIPSGKQKYADFWISQAAVWYYLNGKSNNVQDKELFEGIKDVSWVFVGTVSDNPNVVLASNTIGSDKSSIYFGYGDNSKKIFDEVKVNGVSISQLITNARGKSGLVYGISLSDGEGTITNDANKEYFFSPLYTVVSSVDSTMGELTSYKLDVSAKDSDGNAANLDAKIVDKDGNIINDTSALTPTQLSQFYVRIPVNKVSKNVTVNVKVTGTFKVYDGLRYTSGANTQEVTTVKFVNRTSDSGKSFDLAPAPDTGISAGQKIYFVGLIVLLCGVGIIYANAKPAKAQN